MEGVSLGLGLEADHSLKPSCGVPRGSSGSSSIANPERQLGVAEHTDYGLLHD